MADSMLGGFLPPFHLADTWHTTPQIQLHCGAYLALHLNLDIDWVLFLFDFSGWIGASEGSAQSQASMMAPCPHRVPVLYADLQQSHPRIGRRHNLLVEAMEAVA